MPSFAVNLTLLLSLPTAPAPTDPAVARLDAALEAAWKEQGVTPVPPASDAVFLRRVWLDLAGRVPPPEKAKAFLDDRRPDKRARLVEELLQSEAFADHWGRVMTGWLT